MTSGIVCNDVPKFIASGPRLPLPTWVEDPPSYPRAGVYTAASVAAEGIEDPISALTRRTGIKLAAAFPQFLSHDKVKEAVERLEKRWAKIENGKWFKGSELVEARKRKTTEEKQLALQFTILSPSSARAIGLWLLQDDEQTIVEAAKKNPLVVRYASGRLQDDEPTIMEAAKINPLVVRYASGRFRDNRSLVLKLVSLNGNALAYVNESFKTDIMVMVTAYDQDKAALDLVPVPIKTIVQVVSDRDAWTPKYELKQWLAKRESIITNSSKYGAATIERILSIFYKHCIEDLKTHYKRAQIQKKLLDVGASSKAAMDILGIAETGLRPIATLRDAITQGPEYTQFIDALLESPAIYAPPGERSSPSSDITDSELRTAEQVFLLKVRRNLLKHLKEGILKDIIETQAPQHPSTQYIHDVHLRELFRRKAEENFETSDEAKRDLNSDIMAARAEYEILLQHREERSPANLNRQAALELRSRGWSKLQLLDLLDFFHVGVKKAVVKAVESIRKAPRESNIGLSNQEEISKLIEKALLDVSDWLIFYGHSTARSAVGTDSRFETTRRPASSSRDREVEFVASGPEKPALQPNAAQNASDEEGDDDVLTCEEYDMDSSGGRHGWRTIDDSNFCPSGTHDPDCLDIYVARANPLFHSIEQGYVESPPSTDLKAKGSNVHLETSVKLEEAASAVHHSLASNSAEKALAIFAEDLVGEDVEDLEDGIRGDRLLVEMSSLLGDLNIGDKPQVMEKGFKMSGTLVASEYDLDELDDFYADSGSGMSFEEIGAWSDASVSELDNIPFDTPPQDMMRF